MCNFRSLQSLKVIFIKIFLRISIALIAEIGPGSIPAIVIAVIVGIAQIAEVWFPYNGWDCCTNFPAVLAISAIPVIIWKPGFITLPAPDGDDLARFWQVLFSCMYMYISICVQGLNKFLKFWSKFQPWNCSSLVLNFLGKSQPGCSYKLCSYS